MVKFYLISLFTACTIFLSCNSDNEYTEYDYSNEEKQKLSYIFHLMEEYGWEKDPAISDSKRNQMLLNEDIGYLENILKNFDFEDVESTDNKSHISKSIDREPELKNKDLGNGIWETSVYGNHTSQFITSSTTIIVHYTYPKMFIIASSKINSTPKCSWTPDKSYYKLNKFKYNGYKIEFMVEGTAKVYGISKDITMGAHIYFNESGLADRGQVDSCH